MDNSKARVDIKLTEKGTRTRDRHFLNIFMGCKKKVAHLNRLEPFECYYLYLSATLTAHLSLCILVHSSIYRSTQRFKAFSSRHCFKWKSVLLPGYIWINCPVSFNLPFHGPDVHQKSHKKKCLPLKHHEFSGEKIMCYPHICVLRSQIHIGIHIHNSLTW